MWTDPIVEEVREAREAYFEKFNYDLAAVYRDLKVKEQENSRKIVSYKPKRPIRPVNRKDTQPGI